MLIISSSWVHIKRETYPEPAESCQCHPPATARKPMEPTRNFDKKKNKIIKIIKLK